MLHQLVSPLAVVWCCSVCSLDQHDQYQLCCLSGHPVQHEKYIVICNDDSDEGYNSVYSMLHSTQASAGLRHLSGMATESWESAGNRVRKVERNEQFM